MNSSSSGKGGGKNKDDLKLRRLAIFWGYVFFLIAVLKI